MFICACYYAIDSIILLICIGADIKESESKNKTNSRRENIGREKESQSFADIPIPAKLLNYHLLPIEAIVISAKERMKLLLNLIKLLSRLTDYQEKRKVKY